MFRVRSCVIWRSRRLNRKEPPLKTGLDASVQSFEPRHPALSGSRERKRVALCSGSCERKRVALGSGSCERKQVALGKQTLIRLCLSQSRIGAKRSGSLRRFSLFFPKTPEAGCQGYQNDVNDSNRLALIFGRTEHCGSDVFSIHPRTTKILSPDGLNRGCGTSPGQVFSTKPDPALNTRLPTIFAMPSQTVSSLLRLPRRKRLEIAERLWLSAANEKEMPVPESHKKILEARLGALRSGKSKPISHEELMRRLRTP